MSYVIAPPEIITTAATDLASIGSTLGAASAAAAVRTTGVLGAAGDEVSAAIAAVFSDHGRGFQALSAQAAAFQDRFVQALTAAAGSYAGAEGANAAAFAPPTIGLVMGGSGIPLPNFNIPNYVALADQLYIHPNFPGTTYPAPYANGLFTPEYPLGGLPFSINYPTATSGPLAGFPALSTSMGQGMLILENAISSNLLANHASTVFGWSQSSTIASLVMHQLDPTGQPMPNAGLQFVLVGNPSAPNGGILERFAGLNLPTLGLSFDGATPSNSFPTNMYTLEYDGLGGDFPKYPINFLADLNAVFGFFEIHGLYLTPDVMTPALPHAVLLPGSESLGTPNSLTDYYMIPLSALPYPHNYLPLLQPLLDVPVVGKPLADLLQPDLTVLVNLGYGADNLGYSTPANVPTPFGLFPDVNPATVAGELVTGAQQGVGAFVSDLQSQPLSALMPAASPSSLASLTNLLPALSTAASDPAATISHVVDAFSLAGAALYTPLLPTADVVNAVVTTLPAYDVGLFLDNLSNPVAAIGLPIAADVGLLTVMGGLDLGIWVGGIGGAIGEIAGLIP
jgi:hypothetical protein